MPATFGRVHTWQTDEVIKTADLNAEFNNILNNLDSSGVGGWSVNVAEMQLTTSPGGVGSESLATSLAGEIQRLRYVIQRIIGSSVTQWYQAPNVSLTSLASALGSGTFANRIISGQTTGNSSQLHVLFPQGSASFVLSASAVTPFQYQILGAPYSITASVTVSGLSLAPTSNNFCGITQPPYNGTLATASTITPVPLGQQWTQMWGMFGSTISVTTMGSNIANLVGKLATFQDTSSTEFFLANVASTVALTNAWRGYFFGTTTASTAGPMTTGDSIQLMQTVWVYANTAASVQIGTTNPTISTAQPTSPANGDYWYNLNTNAWMTFTSTQWVTAYATLIGITALNTVGCVAARTFNAYVAPSSVNTLRPNFTPNSTSQVITGNLFSQVAVNGTLNAFQTSTPVWDFTVNMQTGFSVSPGQTYLYMTENGSPVMSPLVPLSRADLLGYYHPQETWRALGSVNVNTSTAFEAPVKPFTGEFNDALQIGGWQPYWGQGPIQAPLYTTVVINVSSANTVSVGSLYNYPSVAGNIFQSLTNLTGTGNVTLSTTGTFSTTASGSFQLLPTGNVTVQFSSLTFLTTTPSFTTAFLASQYPSNSNRFIFSTYVGYTPGASSTIQQQVFPMVVPPGLWKFSGFISGTVNNGTGVFVTAQSCQFILATTASSVATTLFSVPINPTVTAFSLPISYLELSTTQTISLTMVQNTTAQTATSVVTSAYLVAERLNPLNGGI